jgi:lipoprotein-releasing system permease protein
MQATSHSVNQSRSQLPFALFIGLRYVRSKRRNQFMSLVSWLSLGGMMLGVAALIVVMSVMNGFEGQIRGRLMQFLPHGYIESQSRRIDDWQPLMAAVEKQPGIVAVSPFVGGDAMILQGGIVRGLRVEGIDPAHEYNAPQLDRHMLAGRLGELESRRFGIVLGGILARQLGVTLGDKVTVVLPKVMITPAGAVTRSKRFEVVAVFELGSQLDASLAMIHLNDAQKLYALGDAVSGLRVQTDDIYQAPRRLAAVAQNLGSEHAKDKLLVRDWSETQGSLFRALRMEKTMVAVLLFIVVVVAAFNIVSILTMMVAEKRANIAVLRTMGATPHTVRWIFIVQGMVTGLIGILIGATAGTLLAANFSEAVAFLESALGVQVFDPSVFFISEVPSRLELSDVAVVVIGALILNLLATLYPSASAMRIEPAQALHYE